MPVSLFVLFDSSLEMYVCTCWIRFACCISFVFILSGVPRRRRRPRALPPRRDSIFRRGAAFWGIPFVPRGLPCLKLHYRQPIGLRGAAQGGEMCAAEQHQHGFVYYSVFYRRAVVRCLSLPIGREPDRFTGMIVGNVLQDKQA